MQIWDAPFDMACPRVAREVGNRLGAVEKVERRQRQDQQNRFMRVKVEIPISKPLRRGGYLAGSDGEKVWTTFKYERLPMFCHHCGLLGHDIKHCAKYFALTKNGKEAPLQYGEWLKASGGRMWSSPGRKSRNDTTEDDGSVKPNGLGRVAADSHDEVNPSEQEGNGKGNNDKARNNKEAGVNGGEISAQVETDMDWLSTGNRSINYLGRNPESNSNNEELLLHDPRSVVHEVRNVTQEDTNVMHEKRKVRHEEKNVGQGESEHVEEKVSDGPKGTKLKPTWTRITRVSEGNKKSRLIEPNMILGKRGVQLIEVDREADSSDQRSKSEKIQEDVFISKAARVQDHPCRAQ